MEIKGTLGKYKIVETEDGSTTLYSEYFDENCHSTSGAKEETLYNYIQGCQVIEKAKFYGQVSVFEVGFGQGTGLEETLNQLSINNLLKENALTYISTELDEELSRWVLTKTALAQKYDLSSLKEQLIDDVKVLTIENKLFTIHILVGDARETIKVTKYLIDSIDCIYQDAFSPRKNPSLWTKEWFSNLRSLCNEESIISTYSSAISIRKAMIEGGLYVASRSGFGRKRTCTLAYTKEEQAQQSLHNELASSTTPALTDANYKELLQK